MNSKFFLILLLAICTPLAFTSIATLAASTSFYSGGSNINFLYQQGTQRLFSFTPANGSPQLGNFNNGNAALWLLTYPCEYGPEGIFVNANNQVFCFGYADVLKRKGIAIHQINPFAATPYKPTKTYQCPNCLSTGIVGSSDGVAIIPTGSSSFIVFNSQVGKLTCPYNIDGSLGSLIVATTVGELLFVGAMNEESNVYTIQTWNCTGNSVVSEQTIDLSSYQSNFVSHSINLYNVTTLVTVVIQLQDETLFTTIDLNFNTTSPSPTSISNIVSGGYSKISDEVFILVTLDSTGNTLINIYNIGTNLAPFCAYSYSLGYFPVEYIDTIPNTNVIIVYSSANANGELSYIEVNTFTWQINTFYTGNTPLVFSNGSWVYYGNEGYYITNQNKTAITFVSLPVSGYITYPTDYGTVYGVFTSNATYLTTSSAYLVTFNSTASSIQVKKLSNIPCPASADSEYLFELLDVTLNSNCNPCLAYTANSELVVVRNNEVFLTDIYGFDNINLYTDYENDVVRGFVLDGDTSAIVTYAFTNSSQLNTIQTPFVVYSDYTINQSLAWTLSVNGSDFIYYIYDILNNQTVYTDEVGPGSVFQENENGAALIGFNPNLTSLFNGWAIPLQIELTKLQVVRVYEADGVSQDLNFQVGVSVFGWTQSGFSLMSNGDGIIGYETFYNFNNDELDEIEI